MGASWTQSHGRLFWDSSPWIWHRSRSIWETKSWWASKILHNSLAFRKWRHLSVRVSSTYASIFPQIMGKGSWNITDIEWWSVCCAGSSSRSLVTSRVSNCCLLTVVVGKLRHESPVDHVGGELALNKYNDGWPHKMVYKYVSRGE